MGIWFFALNKIQLEAGLALAQVATDAAERLLRLNMQAGKMLVNESAEQAASLMTANGAASLAAWKAEFLDTVLERASGYSRNLFLIVARLNADGSEVLEQKLRESSQEWIQTIDEVSKASPVGDPKAGVAALKAASENARSVIERISKAAKVAAVYADGTVRVAATVAAGAGSSAGKKG